MSEYVGVFEIAKMAGVSRAAVCNWQNRYDDFPKPVAELAQGPVWTKHAIQKWLNEREEKKNAAP